jgi:hypothetical protein
MIFNSSYFTGIIWIMWCDLSEKYLFPDHEEGSEEDSSRRFLAVEVDHGASTFIDAYEIYEMDKVKQMIVPLYFAFTSLSTVGFGDYHPKADHERIICAFILLFGVMIFSYIMGVFIEMIDNFKAMHAVLDAEDELAKFFQIMLRYNYGKPIDEKF